MPTVRGTDIDLRTQDGTADAYLVRPDDDAPHPPVLLYMDAFGIRPALKSLADRLASAGYTVLVPNVFYRNGRTPLLDLPEFIDVSARPDIFESLHEPFQELTVERAMQDADAYLGFLADHPHATTGPAGVTGYCLGGVLAVRTAGAHPERVAAAACFHGSHLASEAPDSPHLLADRITAELYFGHADQDPGLPPEQVARLEEALTSAGVRHKSEVYEGAQHGFTQSDTAAYDATAEERHWEALLNLLRRNL